ncbi:MAG: HAMP domain-containing sensor histidine kinase [Pseudomonadota bacterium]
MASNRGLTRRLGRDLALQAIYISLAALVGVFAVSFFLEDVLIKQALRGEADYYWERFETQPDIELPDTRNMTGYRQGVGDGVPENLRGLDLGFHEQEAFSAITYVSERGDERLYLVFDSVQVNNLILTFGLFPLALVLIVIYLALFSAYRVSRRAVSPVIALADKVQQLDPAAPDVALFETPDSQRRLDDEVFVLSSAMQDLTQRLVDFTERERNFTRDASHELRSPLTVIRMAAGLIGKRDDIDADIRKSVDRITKSTEDMEELTEAFLLLARESGQELIGEPVSVNEIVAEEVERSQMLALDKKVALHSSASHRIRVSAPEKVLASVIGNLLRNGLSYTDEGSVTVEVGDGEVKIIDTGPGMAQEDVDNIFTPFFRAGRRRGGHGVGLTIVKRLSDRFGWPVSIDSKLGTGTTVTVKFPDSEVFSLSSHDLHTA